LLLLIDNVAIYGLVCLLCLKQQATPLAVWLFMIEVCAAVASVIPKSSKNDGIKGKKNNTVFSVSEAAKL